MKIFKSSLKEAGERSVPELHHMDSEERRVKKQLLKLLVSKKHAKYALRLLDFDINLVDVDEFPDYTAGIYFDQAVIQISTGFLDNSPGVFDQLDVLIRHELAHNLMMHQIRMLYTFKMRHKDDPNPDKAAERMTKSNTIHGLLNVIEDLEISNKRYSKDDKRIVRNMMLNGTHIGGLISEDIRDGWENMSLEELYKELTREIDEINDEIRNNYYWSTASDKDPTKRDHIKAGTADALNWYINPYSPSSIYCELEDFIKSSEFSKFDKIYKDLFIDVYEGFKEFSDQSVDKQELRRIIYEISETNPQERYDLINPNSGELVFILYSPEDKGLAQSILKSLCGNVDQSKFKNKVKVKRKTHAKEYKDAWNEIVTTLSNKKDFDDSTLQQIYDEIILR